MFAVNPQPSWINFQPQIPSPLSPRSLNACYDTGHSLSIPMSFPRKSPPKTDPSKHPSRYNVLSHGNKDAERDKRRDLFLKGVRERSEDKRWETRVDQVSATQWGCFQLEDYTENLLYRSKCENFEKHSNGSKRTCCGLLQRYQMSQMRRTWLWMTVSRPH